MEITRDTLKVMMREILEELIWEMEQELPDPDSGLELRPEIIQRLRESINEPTFSLDEIRQELGFDE